MEVHMCGATLLRAAIHGLPAARAQSINCALRVHMRVCLSHCKVPWRFRGRLLILGGELSTREWLWDYALLT